MSLEDGSSGGRGARDAGHGTPSRRAWSRGEARRGGGSLEQGENRIGLEGAGVDVNYTEYNPSFVLPCWSGSNRETFCLSIHP